MLRQRLIKLANENSRYRDSLLRTARAGLHKRADAVFDHKRFPHPDTGNKVKFNSLPPKEQKKIRALYSKKANGKLNKFLDKVRGLDDSVKSKLKSSSAQVKMFVSSPEDRKRMLKGMTDGIKKAPGKIAHKAVHEVKHVAKEYKEAAHAAKKIVTRKKHSPAEKKSLFAVTVATTVAGLAAVSGGLLSGFGTLGVNTGKHMVLNGIHNVFGDGFLALETGVAGKGLLEIFSKVGSEKEVSDDEAMAAVTEQVLKGLTKKLEQGFSDEEMVKILNGDTPKFRVEG